MRIRKEVIRTGDHVHKLPDGKMAVKRVTPADIDRWSKTGNEMLSSSLPIPVPFEHDTLANPLNAADLAAGRVKNNTGFIERFETDSIKDKKTGEQVSRLMSVLDIRDETAAKGVESATIPFVSPWFSTFTDGKGKKWEDVVTHVALTTRPVVHDQEPFTVSTALSLASASLTVSPPAQGFTLSRAGLLRKDGKPRHLCAFSLMSGAKLSAEEIDEVKKEAEEVGEEKEKSKEEGEKPPEKPERKSPLDDDEPEDDANDVSIHEMICHLLKALGFRPPDGMTEDTIERDIYETLMAAMKEKIATAHNNNANTNGGQGRQQPQRQPQIQQEQPPMYMSLTDIMALPADKRRAEVDKITDAPTKANAEAMLSLQAKVEAADKRTVDDAEARRKKRVDALLGKLPKEMRDEVSAQMLTSGAKLSLDGASGAVLDPMDAYLSHMEKMADRLNDALTKVVDPNKIKEQPQPLDGNGMTPEQSKALVDEMTKRSRMGTAA